MIFPAKKTQYEMGLQNIAVVILWLYREFRLSTPEMERILVHCHNQAVAGVKRPYSLPPPEGQL